MRRPALTLSRLRGRLAGSRRRFRALVAGAGLLAACAAAVLLLWGRRAGGPDPGDFGRTARWLAAVAARPDGAGAAGRFWWDLDRVDNRAVSWRLPVRSVERAGGQALVCFEEFEHSGSGFRVTVAVEGPHGRAVAVPAEGWLLALRRGQAVGVEGVVRGVSFANDAPNRNYAFRLPLRDARLSR